MYYISEYEELLDRNSQYRGDYSGQALLSCDIYCYVLLVICHCFSFFGYSVR